MKHVIIIGGGIAGLTTAHELIEQNYKVTLIERNNIIGGLARTYQNEFNKICPYEYSWRAYGQWYQNVYNIMKRIPFNDKETVFDKLVILQGGEKTCSKKIPLYENLFSKLYFSDYLKILSFFIKYTFSCNERNINDYSKIKLREFIKKEKLSKNAEDFIGKIVGPYLGFDYHHASLYDLLYCNEMMKNNSSSEFNFSITSLPTNYVWFDPWIKLLKSKGVNIILNTEVIKININNNIINDIIINDLSIYPSEYKSIKADFYINCTGPEILQKILEPYNLYPNLKDFYHKINKVADNGHQIQLSIYYNINKKIFLDNKNTLAYLPNTPWLLMVLPTGHIWVTIL
jgi:UDP-galactopyranose mutase